jgi:hypothetical protein
MAEQEASPLYLHANVQDIASLANKLTQFSQALSPVELSLFMERIKRSMPGVDVDSMSPVVPSPAVFGAWLNAIVDGDSRWFPE